MTGSKNTKKVNPASQDRIWRAGLTITSPKVFPATCFKALDDLKPCKHRGIGKYEQLITYVKDRSGHDTRYAIDASKISNKLGWKPNETFTTGIKKTVEWYLENTAWLDHVKDGSYIGERLGVVK